MTTAINMDIVLQSYKRATSRLIVLDYDGTLVPFELYPEMARPSVKVKGLIRYLSNDRRNKIILSSGREKKNLDVFFGDLSIVLMAEHGAYIKENEWLPTTTQSAAWIPRAIKALNILKFKYEGSFVERKSLSIAWHYRPIANKIKLADIIQVEANLRLLAEYEDFLVYHSDDTIELRTRDIDKGSALAKWVNNQHYDFILAIGDSLTDEDIFNVLPDNAFTIKVGSSTASSARFSLTSQSDVLPLLQKLTETENLKRDENSVLHQ
jgi:trehalose 6-phosphate synthase/phosphatase